MLELYFLFYYVPKTMSRLARERGRSKLAWSLIGIGAWIGAELAVGFSFGVIQAIGVLWWDWPETESGGLMVAAYLCALGAAIGSFMIVSRILRGKTSRAAFPVPPPPPNFSENVPTVNTK